MPNMSIALPHQTSCSRGADKLVRLDRFGSDISRSTGIRFVWRPCGQAERGYGLAWPPSQLSWYSPNALRYWSHSSCVRFRPASAHAASNQCCGSRSHSTMPRLPYGTASSLPSGRSEKYLTDAVDVGDVVAELRSARNVVDPDSGSFRSRRRTASRRRSVVMSSAYPCRPGNSSRFSSVSGSKIYRSAVDRTADRDTVRADDAHHERLRVDVESGRRGNVVQGSPAPLADHDLRPVGASSARS